jgi:tRNA(adenine34) deaminase
MSAIKYDDKYWMRIALEEASYAETVEEVPVGTVIVQHEKILARAHNCIEGTNDPTGHAELIAIQAAAAVLESRRLEGCTLYTTLEPCTMCAGAIVLARISRLVFGASDPKTGACGSLMNIVQDTRLNHRVEVTSGVLAEECGAIVQKFFRRLRRSS